MMNIRAFSTIAALVTSLCLAPSVGLAGVWTVTNPEADAEYHTSETPIDVTYTWGTGTAANSITVTAEESNGTDLSITLDDEEDIIDATSRQYKCKMTVNKVMPLTTCTITFTVKDINDNVIGTETRSVKIYTHR